MNEGSHEHLDWLKENINVFLRPLMVDILVDRPADSRAYMIRWLERNGRNYEKGIAPVPSGPIKTEQSSEDEKDEDSESLRKLLLKKGKGKKKMAISAEAYGEYNKLGDYEPKIVPKTPEQITQIADVLKRSFMFNSLDKKAMDIVIQAMEIKHFQKDQYVIRQGDDGQQLYIVSSGKLHCYKKFADQPNPKYLCEYIRGGVFGELSLLYNVPRAASIIAVDPSECFSLDRNTFNHIVKTAAIKRRERYDDFINRVELLQSLDPYERGKLCDVLETKRYKKGDMIITQGDRGEEFFLIEEGTAEALKTNEKGETSQVFSYGPNQYFGELALLSDGIRKASIRVTSDEMTVATISRESFNRLLGPLTDILKRNTQMYEKYVPKKL